MRLRIIKSGINGEGIGYWEQKPIFIPSALPGDEVEAEIVKETDTYGLGQLVKVIQQSPDRILPRCEFQAECGGCALMIANQAAQRKLKDANLRQTLIKYAGRVDEKRIEAVVANPQPFAYRNQAKYPIALREGKLWAGFYKSGTNHFVPIATCILHDPVLEAVKDQILSILNRHRFKPFNPPEDQGLRFLILRCFEGKVQVTLVTGKTNLKDELVKELLAIPNLISLYQSVNTDRHAVDPFGPHLTLLGAEATLDFTFADLRFSLTPKAFFQLNATQALAMFEKVVSLIPQGSKVADVYSGIGAMSLMIARKAKSVTGIEVLRASVESAASNAKVNGISNVSFLAGDASKVLSETAKTHAFDVVVVDPPRSGLDDAMLKTLSELKIPKVIYVSCNPSTLAKNLGALKGTYRVKSLTPFDLFTHTPLLEAVVLLEKI